MKRQSHKLLSLFRKLTIIFLLTIVAAGCSNKKPYRIGVAQCSSDPWRWETNDEIDRELMFHDDATVEVRSADDKDEQQIADLNYFIDNDFDLILVNPTRADAITPTIKKAYDKGIPIITFDRRIIGDSYTAHIEVDNEGIGKEAAAYAYSLFPNGAKIIELQGDPEMTPTLRRHEGFVNEISKHPGEKLLASAYGKWNPDTTARLVDSLLNVHPDVDLIYAHSDAMAISASTVARRRGFNNIKILGIDGMASVGIKAVADSVIDATFLYPTYGYTLIRTALAILNGEPYQRETLIPPVSAIDRRNADILLQQDNMMKEETAKILQMEDKIDTFTSLHQAQTTIIYAILIIVALLLITFLLVLRLYRQRSRHQKMLIEANNSKLVFFTNVSHDLRTPLTLIAEPIEQVAAAPYLNSRDHELMKMAKKNVAILRRLIEQILDFRKYENGQLEMHLVETDFRPMFADWVNSFSSAARRLNINLTVDIPSDGPEHLAIDVEKVERIIFNLLSNAFKFTPTKGTIHFSCSCDEKNLTFYVEDNGCGISRADSRKVFDRFYQVDKVSPTGSGIGLALAKAFTELHGGTLSLESEVGKGSRFTVTIPVRHTAVKDAEQPQIATNIMAAPSLAEILTEDDNDGTLPASSEFDETKPLLLAIDDNPDILRMIEKLIGDDYNIISANNGRQGIKLATKYTPDLIICDVMMPVMDGLECCRILKQELATSHIPILMLTARTMEQQRLEGYESGADAYMPKPFSAEMIKARCKNLLDNRRRVRDLYTNPAGIAAPPVEKSAKPTEPALPPVDSAAIDSDFYAEFLHIVGEKMGERDFGVDTVASLMGLGQSQFCRKIKALTNYTPVELIRNLRLRRARTLLMSTDKSISEIAYEVGFTTPAYFSKCYRDAYNESPSDLRDKLKNQ